MTSEEPEHENSCNFLLPVSKEHMSVSGEIAWASEEGIGVKFKPSDSLHERKIESLVNMI